MNKPMITQIAYTGFGGLGSVIFSLIGADTRQDREWAIGFIGDQALEPSYRSRCETAQVRYETFQQTQGKPYAAWWRLARWLWRTKPSVVVCHSITAILPCRWYAWLNRACLVAVEHTPNGVKTGREWAASRLTMLLADRVVLLTPEYKGELEIAHGSWFRPGKVRIIPNGIDTASFHPAPAREAQRPLRLGMAARFSFSKRQDLLIAAIELLRRLHPDRELVLSFAGDGPEFAKVQALAAVSSASPAIRFEGLMPEQDVASWLRTLDIYVHATEGETLSTSLLQAMATGLPIVASDIPGVRNLLGAGNQFGRCVPNEVEAFAGAILECMEEAPDAVAMGARARAQVVAEYSRSAMLRRYLHVFDECRTKRKQSR